jgi:DNA-binding IclR family transcriptional regulator
VDPLSSKETSVSAPERLVRVLDAVAQSDGPLGVREIARLTGINRSVVGRLLIQLKEMGMLEQSEPGGAYAVGPHWYSLSALVVAQDSLNQAARPILASLVNRFNETCYIATREETGVAYRIKEECTQQVRYLVELGVVTSLHAGAGGRAILMAMTAHERDEALAAISFEKVARNTITNRDRLEQRLAADAVRGYSVSVEERSNGGSGVAAPFYSANGRCAGAVVLTRPAARHSDATLPLLGQAIIEAADALSRRLGHVKRQTAP